MSTGWAPPQWDSLIYEKHMETVPKDLWDRSEARRRTEEPRSSATYNPYLTRVQVERLEMDCAKRGTKEGVGQLVKETTNLLTFWRDCSAFVQKHNLRAIGVSNGEFTDLIFVVQQISGSVHGYPITARELRRKGASI